MRFQRAIPLLLFLAAGVAAPVRADGPASEVAPLVVVGDSFSAGVQNTSLDLVDEMGVDMAIDEPGGETITKTLTTDFLGGIFSLDGVHPTDTAYALVANEFIKVINKKFAPDIPPLKAVELGEIAKDDPLVF